MGGCFSLLFVIKIAIAVTSYSFNIKDLNYKPNAKLACIIKMISLLAFHVWICFVQLI